MKSTYKLFSVFWDRREVVNFQFPVVRNYWEILDYHYERELFDVKKFVRKITISKLLNEDDGERISCILHRLKHCSKIIVVIDYFPKVKNIVIQKFIQKRILQVLNFLQKEIPKAKICVTRKVW